MKNYLIILILDREELYILEVIKVKEIITYKDLCKVIDDSD